jgi:hypothetical protein
LYWLVLQFWTFFSCCIFHIFLQSIFSVYSSRMSDFLCWFPNFLIILLFSTFLSFFYSSLKKICFQFYLSCFFYIEFPIPLNTRPNVAISRRFGLLGTWPHLLPMLLNEVILCAWGTEFSYTSLPRLRVQVMGFIISTCVPCENLKLW